mmetsp:Transcript_66764/g.110916  ORF Transcript_66764/g.110916 Transcript_66764/m.110916 type:complete len:258 (-) Transcript_66764:124-897(-)|eukprot:CAMPEP_0119316594 /NCGR_PEP_ID=MMETSP1333-20130426/40142_1 /TAXON_ID=418940 /ORGANISM="Scyphosphaera apsteinii, Strain RCC1455" /LENGTH=257 /DNA_ID=CAMNT_0007322281 /DNA_START=74 /DNA_END=847 /DNA_ORIENTATION=+
MALRTVTLSGMSTLFPTISVTDGNYVWLSDTINNRILQLGLPDLNLVHCMGSFGDKEGQLFVPSGLALVDDTLYIADTENQRVVVTDAHTLRWRGSFRPDPTVTQKKKWTPRFLAVLGDELIVADGSTTSLKVFDGDGSFVRVIPFQTGKTGMRLPHTLPLGMAACGEWLLITERRRFKIVCPVTGHETGLPLPYVSTGSLKGVSVDHAANIAYVVDGGGHRVHAFDVIDTTPMPRSENRQVSAMGIGSSAAVARSS